MDGPMNQTPHDIVNPDMLANPVGFSHAVVAAQGQTVYLGGQAAHDRNGKIVSDDMAKQFAQAAYNLTQALSAAGGSPLDLVSMHIFTTDVDEYRASLAGISAAYEKHFGRYYPAIALFEVKGLFDPAAKVELVAVAVVPTQR
jgi:enamine deaminase RidA (YjgF/YER057c/UK114 family)